MTTSKSAENIINIANILTIFRVFLIFPALLFVVWPVPFHLVYAFLIFILASYTDHLDGKIARKFGYITNFGKIMDPLADKLMVISILTCFCFLEFCSWWPVLLIALRETLITIVRFFALKNKSKVIPANNWGKIKTLSQILAVCFIFLFEILCGYTSLPHYILHILDITGILLIWLSVIFSWISGIIYLRNIKFFK